MPILAAVAMIDDLAVASEIGLTALAGGGM
jgi:hypothetical protein